MTEAELTGWLEERLRGHTFRAVMHRVKAVEDDADRLKLLEDLKANRERDEAYDREREAKKE